MILQEKQRPLCSQIRNKRTRNVKHRGLSLQREMYHLFSVQKTGSRQSKLPSDFVLPLCILSQTFIVNCSVYRTHLQGKYYMQSIYRIHCYGGYRMQSIYRTHHYGGCHKLFKEFSCSLVLSFICAYGIEVLSLDTFPLNHAVPKYA